MKVSILTVVYNGAATIAHCIESVLGQDYGDIEYIVVDGNSKDGTQDIVRSYGDRISRFVSERDSGIYDAMNKGIQLATGDIVGVLNADDFYAFPSVISEVIEAFKSGSYEAVYGDLEYIDANDATVVRRKWVSGAYKIGSFLNGWMPPHPTFFVKREVYQAHGTFRLDLGTAADYELMLRFVHREKIRLGYVPRVLVKMRAGGASNSTLKNRLAANRNDRLAWKINNLTPKFYTLWLKPLRKIVQFI